TLLLERADDSAQRLSCNPGERDRDREERYECWRESGAVGPRHEHAEGNARTPATAALALLGGVIAPRPTTEPEGDEGDGHRVDSADLHLLAVVDLGAQRRGDALRQFLHDVRHGDDDSPRVPASPAPCGSLSQPEAADCAYA